MPKREYNKIKSMTAEQMYGFYGLEKEDDGSDPYRGVYDFGTELHGFGKYVDFEPPKKSMKNFFKKKDLQERYEEYDFYVVTPEFLEYIIELYTEKVRSFYKVMLDPFFDGKTTPSEFLNSIKTEYGYPENKYTFDFTKITDAQQTGLFNLIEHVKSMGVEWGVKSFLEMKPYDLTRGDEVTNSWKYEYTIFDLVRIYKTFDWKKNVMIYYGY